MPTRLRIAMTRGDPAAIALSGLCLVHCLILPLLLASLPWLTWMVDHESLVHRLLLLAIVPISIHALKRGCARHGHCSVLWLGSAALLGLTAATLLPPTTFALETPLTVLGSIVLTASHLLNLRALKRCPASGQVHA